MHVKVVSRSDVGRVRTNNEDSFYANADTGLFIVCDGMGGHNAGEVASRICCDTLVQEMTLLTAARHKYEQSHQQNDIKALLTAVEHAMSLACKEIFRQASGDSGKSGMGTTCTMVLLAGHGKAILAHVGDSRLYVLRGGQVHQLSEDHTYVQDLLRRGAITREMVKGHPQGNVLSRAMGVQPSVNVDTMIFDMDAEDTYLLCSDGIYNYYPEAAEIAAIIDDTDLEHALHTLIHHALERGGHDNGTAIILRTSQPVSQAVNDPAVAAQRRIAALQRIPIFAHLTYHELVKVLGLTQMTHLPAHTTFIREGQAGNELFVILSGQVDVLKGGSKLSSLTAGAHLGEMAMVDNAPRSATAVSRSEVNLLVMRRDEFFGIIRGEPVIASKLLWSFMKVLSGRLRKANDALQDARHEGGHESSSDEPAEFDIFKER